MLVVKGFVSLIVVSVWESCIVQSIMKSVVSVLVIWLIVEDLPKPISPLLLKSVHRGILGGGF